MQMVSGFLWILCLLGTWWVLTELTHSLLRRRRWKRVEVEVVTMAMSIVYFVALFCLWYIGLPVGPKAL